MAMLKELLERNPDDSFARYALALEHVGLNETDQALSLLEDLLHRDPTYVPAYQQLGYLYQKLDRRDDAVSIFTQGMEVASRQGDFHARGEMEVALNELSD
jgi:Tfp pilus assembly protein PilF